MKNVTVLNSLTWVLSTKERKKDACCIIIFYDQSGLVQRCIFHEFFFPVHRHPHPRSVIFNMVPYLLYTVFSMYTLCKSRAFLQNYLILSFQFFQAEVKCYFLILGWLLEKKSFFSVYFAFYLIICCYLQQDVTFCSQQHHHHKKVTISPWPANSMCKPFGQECALWICWYE